MEFELEDLKIGFERFNKENGHYPSAWEVDHCKYLPSSRQIQRRFNGLRELRKRLGIEVLDKRTGNSRILTMQKIIPNHRKTMNQIHDVLEKRFGKEFVHREWSFGDDRRNRADFYVYTQNGNFVVDIFHPQNLHSLVGCLNIKQKKYSWFYKVTDFKDEIIFIPTNIGISQEEINNHLKRKENKLRDNEKVMTLEEFRKFSQEKIPILIGKGTG